MKTSPFPVNLPEDLHAEIKRTAEATGLSMADALRQGVKLGLPLLREQLCTSDEDRLTAIRAAYEHMTAKIDSQQESVGKAHLIFAEAVRELCRTKSWPQNTLPESSAPVSLS